MNGPHMATGRFEVGDPTLSAETSNNFDITVAEGAPADFTFYFKVENLKVIPLLYRDL